MLRWAVAHRAYGEGFGDGKDVVPTVPDISVSEGEAVPVEAVETVGQHDLVAVGGVRDVLLQVDADAGRDVDDGAERRRHEEEEVRQTERHRVLKRCFGDGGCLAMVDTG